MYFVGEIINFNNFTLEIPLTVFAYNNCWSKDRKLTISHTDFELQGERLTYRRYVFSIYFQKQKKMV